MSRLGPSERTRRLVLAVICAGAMMVAVVVGVVSAASPSRIADNARASAAAGLTTPPQPIATATGAFGAQSSVLSDEGPWMAAFGELETGRGGLGVARVAAERVATGAKAARAQVAGMDAASWQAAGVRDLAHALGAVERAAGQAAAAATPGAYDADAQSLMAAFDALAATSERSLASDSTP